MSLPASLDRSTPALDAQVRDWLASRTGTEAADWHLVSKARHGMLEVLAELAAARGPGEVVTQPFTCLTAVSPVAAAGHRPRYVDIDAHTLTIDPSLVPAALSDRTRAVVAQHTFGGACPVARVREAAPEPLLLEDSAHCLGTLARDAAGRPVADVSVHSFGLEKMLPTRFGGAVWVNPAMRDGSLRARLDARLRGLPAPRVRDDVASVASTPVRRVFGRLGGAGTRAQRVLARTGAVDLAIMPGETDGVVAGAPTRLGGRPLTVVAEHLVRYPSNAEHRRRVGRRYAEALQREPSVTVPRALAEPGLALVRFPVLARTPAAAVALFDRLQARGLVPGRWYRPTLFPGPTDPGPFGYDPSICPLAEDASARVVNLPTAPFVTPSFAQEVIRVVADPGA